MRDLKVLFINGEDSTTEIRRRILAFRLAHSLKIGGQSLNRLLVLGADNPKVRSLSFLQTEKTTSTLDQSGFEALHTALETLRPDLVVIDPLVAFCGGGNMNDNSVMSLVIRELKRLAVKFDCAVLIIHHTRKGGDVGSAEAISGAAAIVNLARRAIMPVPMSNEEANKSGVLPSEQFRFFKLVDAKSNLAPRAINCPWYKLHSIDLQNAEPPIYPYGDNVQAVERVNLPLMKTPAVMADEQKIQRAIIDLINCGKLIAGQTYPYSPSLAGADNERTILDDAKAAIATATAPRQWQPHDLNTVVKKAIKQMQTDGWIAKKKMKELLPDPGRFRKGYGLTVDTARTPVPNLIGKDTAAEAAPDGGGQLVNDPVNN